MVVDVGVLDIDDMDIAGIGDDAYVGSFAKQREWEGREMVDDDQQEYVDRFVDSECKG